LLFIFFQAITSGFQGITPTNQAFTAKTKEDVYDGFLLADLVWCGIPENLIALKIKRKGTKT